MQAGARRRSSRRGSRPSRAAWFSVDATDSDPVRFWGAVIAALDGVVPGFATRSARLLGAPSTSTTADVVPALLDELAALDAPVTLVVDDYHLADSAEIHIGLGFLATHLPATLRLVLVSRTEPPLPLARLRGQGRVAELGTEDLRLSAAESAELLDVEGAVTGTAWTPDDAARLHVRTEGWVIGVHLGVLSRRGHPDTPSPGPSSVSSGAGAGPTRHLVDYLRRDVLDRLPDELHEVLRRTAVLDAFRADLAAEVTGRPDAAALLARAEREQLFVVPLDDSGNWYRFHHLFAEVLRDDLAAAEPDLVPQLHARAALWWAAHDQPVAAVGHALAGDDRGLTAALVARHAPVLTRIGQVETGAGLVPCARGRRLPRRSATRGRPRPHRRAHRAAARDRLLDRRRRTGPRRPRGRTAARPCRAEVTAARIEIAMMMRWTAAIFDGDARGVSQHLDEILRLLPDGAATSSGFALLARGVSQFRASELDAAWVTLSEAQSAGEERGEPVAVVAARGLRALLAALDGRPEEAALLAGSAEAAAAAHGLVEHFNTATFRAAQGWVALQEGRPRRAVEHFRRALELVRRRGMRVEVAELLTALAQAEERLGRRAAAGGHRDEARQILASCPDPGYVWADPRTAEPARPRHDSVRLTRRQAEILALLAEALTTAEIGERLKLSPRTVEAHLRTLYRKIEVRSRTAAARYAVDHGWTAARHAP